MQDIFFFKTFCGSYSFVSLLKLLRLKLPHKNFLTTLFNTKKGKSTLIYIICKKWRETFSHYNFVSIAEIKNMKVGTFQNCKSLL